jgi:hypothetical protein
VPAVCVESGRDNIQERGAISKIVPLSFSITNNQDMPISYGIPYE